MSDSLDDLAAFLMHRSGDENVSEADRLSIWAVVRAYQEGYDPAQVEPALWLTGAQFADHPDHQQRWLPAAAAPDAGVLP